MLRVVREHPDVTLVPPSSLKLDLKWKAKVQARVGQASLGAEAAANRAAKAALGTEAAANRAAKVPRLSGPVRPGAGKRPGFGSNTPSWWTARATEEEVKPGFSKEAIIRPPKEDPRAEEGVLTRVGGLLSELAGKG